MLAQSPSSWLILIKCGKLKFPGPLQFAKLCVSVPEHPRMKINKESPDLYRPPSYECRLEHNMHKRKPQAAQCRTMLCLVFVSNSLREDSGPRRRTLGDQIKRWTGKQHLLATHRPKLLPVLRNVTPQVTRLDVPRRIPVDPTSTSTRLSTIDDVQSRNLALQRR